MTNTHLSIILPVYNAGTFFANTLKVVDNFLVGLTCSSELIIVDDESRDNSRKVIEEWLCVKRPYLARLIAHTKNVGKGGAVASGMLVAHGDFRIFLDADLAYEPSQILRILEALENGADVAIASRVHPETRYTMSPAFFHYLYTRHLASRIINFVMRRTILPHCNDSQAGLKGFKADVAEAIFSRQTIKGFSFDIEVLYLAERMGTNIREVPVDYKYFNEPTTVGFLKDGLGILRDVFGIRFRDALGQYKLPQNIGRRRLAINADDFGMTLAVSRGILKVAANGTVTSTSAMANSPDFDASMDEIVSSHLDIDVGFHVVLTWGKPISNPKDIPTLVDHNGNFLSKRGLFFQAITGKISEGEVYQELHAQGEKLLKRWPRITHLNGHHHVHVFPVIRQAVERIAREFGIQYIRSPREKNLSSWYKAFFRKTSIALLQSSKPAYWRSRGFLSSDNFGGFLLGGEIDLKERWIETLNRLPCGMTEIMVHPGYFSPAGDHYNIQRENEVRILSDKTFVENIKNRGIELVSIIEGSE